MEEFVDFLRMCNIGLSMLSVTLLIMTLMNRWDQLSARVRRISIWVAFLMAVWCYGSGETLVQDVEPGVRVPLSTIGLLGLNFTILWRFNEGR